MERGKYTMHQTFLPFLQATSQADNNIRSYTMGSAGPRRGASKSKEIRMKVTALHDNNDESPFHITEPVLSSKAYRKRWAALIKKPGMRILSYA